MSALTKEQVTQKQVGNIPEFVIDIFNNKLIGSYSGTIAIIKVKDVVEEIENYLNSTENSPQYNSLWLNIEPIFINKGWRVEFIKAHYSDDGGSYYKFS